MRRNKNEEPSKTLEQSIAEIDVSNLFDPTSARWVARMLVEGGALEQLVKRARFTDDVLELLDLPSDCFHGLSSEGQLSLVTAVRSKLEALKDCEEGAVLVQARRLGAVLHFSELEQEVLTFLYLADEGGALEDVWTQVRGATHKQGYRSMAIALGCSAGDIEATLRRGALLRSLGVVRHDPERSTRELLLDDLVISLLRCDLDAEALKRAICGEAPAAKLGLGDYPHLHQELEILLPYLRSCLGDAAKGVNILVHGPAGTGKTELVRAVAKELSASLHEVRSGDDEGAPSGDKGRITSYAMGQRLLRTARDTLLLFDEIEDIFPWKRAGGWLEASSGSDKAWTNRLLEKNPIPCLWVGNAVGHLDAAFLRRFALVIEVPVPTLKVRQQIMGKHLASFKVSEKWLSAQSKNPNLSPADSAHAAEVVQRLEAMKPKRAEELLERVLNMSLEARDQAFVQRDRVLSPFKHDLSLLNVDCNVGDLISQLAKRKRGAICLYGPPGTGKSVLVGRIADELGKECMMRSGGDLLGMYVGQTEARIQEMFREASRSGAVLFLDEADGLLRDRALAEKSWEATMVNEFLVRMELFEGIFFCATNLPEKLDRASLRRFSLKLRFDPLKKEQSLTLLTRTLGLLGARAPTNAERAHLLAQLGRLDALTPGDFAAVVRGAELTNGQWDSARLLAALEEECAFKGPNQRVVGFGRG